MTYKEQDPPSKTDLLGKRDRLRGFIQRRQAWETNLEQKSLSLAEQSDDLSALSRLPRIGRLIGLNRERSQIIVERLAEVDNRVAEIEKAEAEAEQHRLVNAATTYASELERRKSILNHIETQVNQGLLSREVLERIQTVYNLALKKRHVDPDLQKGLAILEEREKAEQRVQAIQEPDVLPNVEQVTPSTSVEESLEGPSKPLLEIDEGENELKFSGKVIKLTDDEYNLFFELADPDTPGQPISNTLLRYRILPGGTLSQVNAIANVLARKLKRATKRNDLIITEPRPKSALFSLANCEVVFINSPIVEKVSSTEAVPTQPTVPIESPLPTAPETAKQVNLVLGQGMIVVIDGKESAINTAERRMLSYFAAVTPGTEFRGKTKLAKAIFGSSDQSTINDFDHYVSAINTLINRAAGIKNAIKRSKQGTSLVYTLQITLNISAPQARPDSTPLTPEVAEDKEFLSPFDKTEEAVLAALVQEYNGEEIITEDDIHFVNFDQKALEASGSLLSMFTRQNPNYFHGKQKVYARTRAAVIEKLITLFSAEEPPGYILAQQPSFMRTILSNLFQHPGESVRAFLSYVAKVKPKEAWENERKYMTRGGRAEAPFLNAPVEPDSNGDSKPADERESKDKFQAVAEIAPPLADNSYPVGFVEPTMGEHNRPYTLWDDLDIAKFIVRQLSNTDLRNTQLLDILWASVRYAQTNPEDPRSARPKTSGNNLRSINPKFVPGLYTGKINPRDVRLVYKFEKLPDGTSLVVLDKVFRDHKKYSIYLSRGNN